MKFNHVFEDLTGFMKGFMSWGASRLATRRVLRGAVQSAGLSKEKGGARELFTKEKVISLGEPGCVFLGGREWEGFLS